MIRNVIGAEIEPRALPCPCGQKFEELRLENPVLVMAFFWPRIGKQDPDLGKGNAGWEALDEFAGFSPDKMAMGKPGAVCLSPGALDAFVDHINAKAGFVRVLRRIPGQEVPVAAADLQHDGRGRREKQRQLGAQRGAALSDVLDEFRFEAHAAFYVRKNAKRQVPNDATSRSWGNPLSARAQSPSEMRGLPHAFRLRGRRRVMAKPEPARFSAHTCPPWSWAICLTMLSPRPVPPVSRERPFSTR
jgi:hypothetical protein